MTAGHKSFTLAADNESDMQDWLSKLQSVLSQNKMQEDTRSASLEREKSKIFVFFGTKSIAIHFLIFVENLFQRQIQVKIPIFLER